MKTADGELDDAEIALEVKASQTSQKFSIINGVKALANGDNYLGNLGAVAQVTGKLSDVVGAAGNIKSGVVDKALATTSPTSSLMQKFALGAAGSSSGCNTDTTKRPNQPFGNGCVWNASYCVNKFDQCGILESEVEAKCGEWTECGAVVCRADYGGYCLARRAFDGTAVSTAMWGYKRIMYSENADLEAVLIEVAAAIPAPDLQKVFD